MPKGLTQKQIFIKAKFYRFMATAFAITGLILFAFNYFQFSSGDFFYALSQPDFIVIILMPFIPAALLSWMAMRLEKKTEKMDKQRKGKTSR